MYLMGPDYYGPPVRRFTHQTDHLQIHQIDHLLQGGGGIVDTDMAKANANMAPDPETRKLLWLKIARREVERCRSADIEGTLRVLQARPFFSRFCLRSRAHPTPTNTPPPPTSTHRKGLGNPLVLPVVALPQSHFFSCVCSYCFTRRVARGACTFFSFSCSHSMMSVFFFRGTDGWGS